MRGEDIKMETILGVFTEREDADRAILELEKHYFDPKDISIIAKDHNRPHVNHHLDERSAGENVAVGAVDGAAAGGLLGGLTGALVGAGVLAIPGIGAFLIGGPIAIALGLTGAAAMAVSAAATGAVAGGVIGALAGLGLPTSEAKEYEQYIREGAILLALQVGSDKESDAVRHIFEKYDAAQIRTIGTHHSNQAVMRQ